MDNNLEDKTQECGLLPQYENKRNEDEENDNIEQIEDSEEEDEENDFEGKGEDMTMMLMMKRE